VEAVDSFTASISDFSLVSEVSAVLFPWSSPFSELYGFFKKGGKNKKRKSKNQKKTHAYD
jgi:hypothetical protein